MKVLPWSPGMHLSESRAAMDSEVYPIGARMIQPINRPLQLESNVHTPWINRGLRAKASNAQPTPPFQPVGYHLQKRVSNSGATASSIERELPISIFWWDYFTPRALCSSIIFREQGTYQLSPRARSSRHHRPDRFRRLRSSAPEGNASHASDKDGPRPDTPFPQGIVEGELKKGRGPSS